MLRGCPTLGDEAANGPEKRIVYLKEPSGRQPAQRFHDRLPLRDAAKFMAQMRNMAERGRLPREQFAKVDGAIFAFKTKAYRLLCFFDAGGLIVLVDGEKIDEKLPGPTLARARRLHAEYQRSKVAAIHSTGE